MSNVFISIFAFVAAISVLVAVHEYGHFWVARKLGIKVLRFSIGFGKPLWRRVSGPDATEYVIAAIPLGGYVKLLDEREGEVAAADLPRAFNRKPVGHRVAVLVAGPAFNFLFAIVAYWLVLLIGVPGLRPVVGEVDPQSEAARAGLVAGDEIVAVGSRATGTWEATLLAILDELLDDGSVPLEVRDASGRQRDLRLDLAGRESELTEPGKLFSGIGMRPWRPHLLPVINEVLPGYAAERAGLQSGDRIVAADGEPIGDWQDWFTFIRAHPEETVSVELERGGAPLVLELAIGREGPEGETYGYIGASGVAPEIPPEMVAEQRYSLLPAFAAALEKTWDMSALTLKMLWKMVLGEVSVRNISGPINIAQYAGYTASIGLAPFLSFLAIVSVSLGLINLMPIPMLDGGQLVYQFAELVKGSPVSMRTQIVGQHIGIALLLVIMSFTFYNDIARLME